MMTRILSGIVMAILAVLAVFKLPSLAFNALLGLIMLAGLFEWKRLCAASTAQFMLYAIGLIACFSLYSLGNIPEQSLLILLGLGVLAWLFKTTQLSRKQKPSPMCLAEGAMLLGLAWLAMVYLRDSDGDGKGSLSLMLVLLMVWGADSFAYFGGKRFGKTKLAPSISPGKTREGVASGVVAAMLIAVVYTHFLIMPFQSGIALLMTLVIAAFVALISVVGDLSESKLKRAAGMKDSGNLIPGHGGILDRIDGLIAGVVVYAFYAMIA